jgi:hypothetical protein
MTELNAFYAGLVSIMILMGLSKYREFKTLKERVGLSTGKNVDYLHYIIGDFHFFLILVTQIVLFFLMNYSNYHYQSVKIENGEKDVDIYEGITTQIVLLIRYVAYFMVVMDVFFPKGD